MQFNSLIFLYLFLPVILIVIHVSPKTIRNTCILLISWVFYAWGGVSYIAVLLGSILLNYLIGLAIDHGQGELARKRWFLAGVILNLLFLGVFKYNVFFIDNVNVLTSIFGVAPWIVKNIFLPLGISFFTFKALTYLISVKRREVPVQKNFINLALYISLFPQLIAGPIDRYKNLLPQLQHRVLSFEQFSSGVQRFVLGLFKKVIISGPLAYVADQVFTGPANSAGFLLSWLGAICFALQIYYDFSGYTDMAVGIGRMLGFRFVENFNFPYISRSVHEFWQRWHISLSTWLRDYLFLPVAFSTSRRLKNERYLGIRVDRVIYTWATLVTFVLCGFWHGAAWNFVIWGLIHGIMLSMERGRFGKWLDHGGGWFGHLYLPFFVVVTLVIFRTATPDQAFSFIASMFDLRGNDADWGKLLEYLNPGFILVFILAVAGSTRIFDRVLRIIRKGMESRRVTVSRLCFHFYNLGILVFILFALALSTLTLIAGTNSSFIYFRF